MPEPGTEPTRLTITTDAPADPATVTEYGDALPELVRALNHVTRHHEALGQPVNADRLIRNVALAVSRLPQLLSQIGLWLGEEQLAGRIRVDSSGGELGGPATAVVAVRVRLDEAAGLAEALHERLDAAASVTGRLGAEAGEGGGNG
jgi:hypothetical protein